MKKKPEPMSLFGDEPSDKSDAVEGSHPTPDDPPSDAVVPDSDRDDEAQRDIDADPEPEIIRDADNAETVDDAHADAPVQSAEPSEGDGAVKPVTPASVAATGVGSPDEMDAWLLGSPEPPVSTAWLASDSEADAAMAAWIAAAPGAVPIEDGPAIVSAGRVERIRPARRPLVPQWLIWVAVGALVLGIVLASTAGILAVRSRVLVPTVAGLQTPAAKERLATVGLTLTVSDRRFSTLPVDTILAQTPEAGTQAKRGSAVTVVVSAGTEEFTMPDVVGQGLALARQQLEQRGLQVQVEAQTSDQPSDTVLATNPAAGSAMHTGDIVKLTVATGTNVPGSGTATGTLVPYSLSGVRVTLDPAPPVAGQPDIALEVSRRLQSLLEASGAKVISTRTVADSGANASATSRQLRAKEGSPTVAVGFDIIATGSGGVALTYPSPNVAPALSAPSQTLSSQITSALAGQAINARQAAGGSDVVLSVTGSPYVRETLGSTASQEDLAHFKDPGWADKIARANYLGIAAIYGIRNATAP